MYMICCSITFNSDSAFDILRIHIAQLDGCKVHSIHPRVKPSGIKPHTSNRCGGLPFPRPRTSSPFDHIERKNLYIYVWAKFNNVPLLLVRLHCEYIYIYIHLVHCRTEPQIKVTWPNVLHILHARQFNTHTPAHTQINHHETSFILINCWTKTVCGRPWWCASFIFNVSYFTKLVAHPRPPSTWAPVRLSLLQNVIAGFVQCRLFGVCVLKSIPRWTYCWRD